MNKSYFEILRPGVNTTIQDKGRYNLYHIGVSVSGAIDQRNYKLANSLVGNNLDEAVIEFAYQGPLLKLKNANINFAITGDILFKIIRKNSKIEEVSAIKLYFRRRRSTRYNFNKKISLWVSFSKWWIRTAKTMEKLFNKHKSKRRP